MIKVLEEKPVPKATVRCSNCDSLLEYGNSDLWEEDGSYSITTAFPHLNRYYFVCPVCGCKVYVNWIVKENS